MDVWSRHMIAEQEKRLYSAILHHWGTDPFLSQSRSPLRKAAAAHPTGVVLDTVLSTLAEQPDVADPYFTLAEFALLSRRLRQARLLLRTMERRLAIDETWAPPGITALLSWLAQAPETALPSDIAKTLVESGPSPLRRAFVPMLLQTLSETGALTLVEQLANQWYDQQYPQEPESWWAKVFAALELYQPSTLQVLLEQLPEAFTLHNEWQWSIAIRLAERAPEPRCWTLCGHLVHVLSTDQAARKLLAQSGLLSNHLASATTTQALVIRALLLLALGRKDEIFHMIALHVPQPDTPTEQALLGAIVVSSVIPSSYYPFTPWLERLLKTIPLNRELMEQLQRLIPSFDTSVLAEWLLRTGNPHLTERAIILLDTVTQSPAELVRLAERLELHGLRSAATRVLRLAARFYREQRDQAGLLKVLKMLAQYDPTDQSVIELVVTHETRVGRHAETIDLLLAAATEAERLQNPGLKEKLLHRAALLAELSDDRTRLALLAERLVEDGSDDPERLVTAATLLIRAGEAVRARTHLWSAVEAALRLRKLPEALAAAEQLVALDPTDQAVRNQLHDVQALVRRLGRTTGKRTNPISGTGNAPPL